MRRDTTHLESQSSRMIQDIYPPSPLLDVDDAPAFMQDQEAVLPSLYNDDLSMIQFDDIFGGDSDKALDKFFTDVFSLPSYPPVTVVNESIIDTSPRQPIPVLRRYKSDEEVISAYYELIHPGFPILPPPPEQDAEDCAEPWIPTGEFFSDYEPSSPLILALLSILILLPHSSDDSPSDEAGRELRAGYSQSLAQCAIECIGIASDMNTPSPTSFSRSFVHSHVPTELETPMAFCVLSIYQYLHHGNIGKMTQMAEEAFDSAVKLSLHNRQEDDSEFSEARRRTWWMTYLCMCNASIVSCKPPTRPMAIDTFTTPYPSTGNDSEVWSRYIRAEETLVSATLLLVALVRGVDSRTAIVNFRQNISLLDSIIKSQLEGLIDVEDMQMSSNQSSESRAGVCLKKVTWIRLTSSHIKTHRYRAFMDSLAVLKRFESVPFSDMPEGSSPTNRASGLQGSGIACEIFPFTVGESTKICLESSTRMAATLECLSSDIRVAPFACSVALAGYTALMMHYFQTSGIEDSGERLIATHGMRDRCEAGVKASIRALDNFSVGFACMRTLNDQLRRAASACKAI